MLEEEERQRGGKGKIFVEFHGSDDQFKRWARRVDVRVLEKSFLKGALKIERKDKDNFTNLMDFVLQTNLEHRRILSSRNLLSQKLPGREVHTLWMNLFVLYIKI